MRACAVNAVDGELLHINKVSRLHMTAYLCVASNGVPPSISKRVQLRVQCKCAPRQSPPLSTRAATNHSLTSSSAVPPMLTIPNQLEGAYLGQNVTLECQTEAYPVSINFWTTDRGDMIISGERFRMWPRITPPPHLLLLVRVFCFVLFYHSPDDDEGWLVCCQLM